MGAVTVSRVRSTGLLPTGKAILCDITFSGTYGAGGDTYTPSLFGMTRVDAIIPQGDAVGSATTGYAVAPDIAGNKIRLLGGAASGVAHAETGTAGQSATVARCIVIGDLPNV
jgi:hypothetical protein